jgi:hypothetical protein
MFTEETNLRRSFTVRSSDATEGNADLLSIDKKALCRMRIEFRANFKEFFLSGMNELEKCITLKMYAMEVCDRRFKEWMAAGEGVPDYDVKQLSNVELKDMSAEEIVEFTKK